MPVSSRLSYKSFIPLEKTSRIETNTSTKYYNPTCTYRSYSTSNNITSYKYLELPQIQDLLPEDTHNNSPQKYKFDISTLFEVEYKPDISTLFGVEKNIQSVKYHKFDISTLFEVKKDENSVKKDIYTQSIKNNTSKPTIGENTKKPKNNIPKPIAKNDVSKTIVKNNTQKPIVKNDVQKPIVKNNAPIFIDPKLIITSIVPDISDSSDSSDEEIIEKINTEKYLQKKVDVKNNFSKTIIKKDIPNQDVKKIFVDPIVENPPIRDKEFIQSIDPPIIYQRFNPFMYIDYDNDEFVKEFCPQNFVSSIYCYICLVNTHKTEFCFDRCTLTKCKFPYFHHKYKCKTHKKHGCAICASEYKKKMKKYLLITNILKKNE